MSLDPPSFPWIWTPPCPFEPNSSELLQLLTKSHDDGCSLAKRRGEHEFAIPGQSSSSAWLSQYNEELPILSRQTRVLTFASIADKSSGLPVHQGQRSVRTLPFSEAIFRLISKHYHIHHSISSVVSRADIPAFFSAEVEMETHEGASCMAEGKHLQS